MAGCSDEVSAATVRIDGRDHLSSAQVARFLGIKPETVYAYVSRGVLHRVRLPGRRESYFAVAEVEALVRPAAPARRRAPGLADDIRTAITLVEGDRLSYRGIDAGALADSAGFAEVCALLWQHPAELVVDPDGLAAVRAGLAGLPSSADPATRVRVTVAVLGARDLWRADLEPSTVARTAGRLIMTSAAALAPPGTPLDRSVAGALAAAAGTDQVRWVEQALVLLADHDLAGSTTAVRVAASARADPYSAIGAGLGAWDSPLHGTAGRAAYAMLGDLLADPGRTAAALSESRTAPPGFGHVVYTDVDPRAELLIARLHDLGGHLVLDAAERLAEVLWRRRGLPRNVDLALALAGYVLGTGRDLGELVFLHARMAGWVAHILEEYACPPLRFRLHGVYTGPRP